MIWCVVVVESTMRGEEGDANRIGVGDFVVETEDHLVMMGFLSFE